MHRPARSSWSLGAALALSLSAHTLTPERARAQAYQDSTSASYAAAGLELALVIGGLSAIPLSGTRGLDRDHRELFLIMNALTILAAAGVSGGVADASSAPAELPLVWHGTLTLAASMALFWGGYASIFDDDEGPLIGGVVGGILGAIGGAAWTATAAERLARDPEHAGPAHLLTWAPVPLAALGATIGLLIDDDSPVAAGMIGGALGIAAWLTAYIWSEDILSEQTDRAEQAPRELVIYFPYQRHF